jgi:vacuolar protein sorting-associated protein 13A/C
MGAEDGGNAPQEQGFVAKIVARVLDNIQLKIRNVHVRWEERRDGYSCGCALESLSAVTTNERWEEKYINRAGKRDVAVNKLVTLGALSVYWTQRENLWLS